MIITSAIKNRLNRSDPVRSITYGVGLGSLLQSMELLLTYEIRGRWFYVDPTDGNNGYDGLTKETAVADIREAYNRCVSGNGDGIRVYSRGTTSAGTTSYLKYPLAWTKHGITVIGVAAPSMMGGRARISNKEVATGSLTTIAFVDTAGVYTITDSAAGFITAGFIVGQTIDVDSNSNTNDGQYTVTKVEAGALTVTESVTDESAATAGATTITSFNAQLLNISGDNNSFFNIYVANHGSNAYAVGSVLLSGMRNAFLNVHMYGAGHATPAAVTGAYDLELDGSSENTFYGCMLGSDTTVRDAVNANIRLDGTCGHEKFIGCEIRSHSENAGHGAIMCVDITGFADVIVFKDCWFINTKPNGMSALTSAFIGSKPNSGYLLLDGCSLLGWAAWDSAAGNDRVFVANSAAVASGGGGIATTP